MNRETRPTVRVAGRMRELLYAAERGSASPEMAGWLFGPPALIVGLFCLFWSFRGGDPLIPLWLSWALVVVPVAGLLWHFAVADLLHRITERRNRAHVP